MKGVMSTESTLDNQKLIIATIFAGIIAREDTRLSVYYCTEIIQLAIKFAQEIDNQLERLEKGESID